MEALRQSVKGKGRRAAALQAGKATARRQASPHVTGGASARQLDAFSVDVAAAGDRLGRSGLVCCRI